MQECTSCEKIEVGKFHLTIYFLQINLLLEGDSMRSLGEQTKEMKSWKIRLTFSATIHRCHLTTGETKRFDLIS